MPNNDLLVTDNMEPSVELKSYQTAQAEALNSRAAAADGALEASKQALNVMYAFGAVEGLQAVELGRVAFA